MTRISTRRGAIEVRRFPGDDPSLLALHGFTQHGAMFAELAGMLPNAVLAPDLPGHGATSVPPSINAAIEVIRTVAAQGPAPTAALGYSQGARLLLLAALRHPALFSRLVLISGSAGISDPGRRRTRAWEDEALAAEIERIGVRAFIDGWLASPMFAGLQHRDPEWQEADRALRLECTVAGLAGALRHMGQGAQPYVESELGGVTVPVLLVVGEEDERYRRLAETMQGELPDARVEVIPGAGHAVIGEAPRRVAALVEQFIT